KTKIKPKVLIVDDSITARIQIKKVVKSLNLDYIEAVNGRDGFQKLLDLADQNKTMIEEVLIVISDAEMPEMDGYTFITEIRNDPRLEKLYVILHTSMSGSFNQNMVIKVGADGFLAKFQATKLAELLQERIKAYKEGNHGTTVPSSEQLAAEHQNQNMAEAGTSDPTKLDMLDASEVIEITDDIEIEGLPSVDEPIQENQEKEEEYLNQLLQEVKADNSGNNANQENNPLDDLLSSIDDDSKKDK
ncbi:response regulator, partial [Piscirickettsia litoralis]|uniref:response regulator n=1 Tax=Piscirickettsia litoralis TaxID=1891921 RepID=UPI001112CB31